MKEGKKKTTRLSFSNAAIVKIAIGNISHQSVSVTYHDATLSNINARSTCYKLGGTV